MFTSLRKLNQVRSANHIVKVNEAFFQNTMPSTQQMIRFLWGFGGKNDDDPKNSTKPDDSVTEETSAADEHADGSSAGSSGKAGLIMPFGDNSPTISPLIILPTNRRPVFPGYLSLVTIKDKATIDAITNSKAPHYLGIFLRQDAGKHESPPVSSSSSSSMSQGNDFIKDVIKDSSELYKTGTFAQVNTFHKTELGLQLIVMGHRRITLKSVNSYGPPTIAEVKHWPKVTTNLKLSQNVKAYSNEIVSIVRELIKLNPFLGDQMISSSSFQYPLDVNDPYRLADFATALTTAEGYELQKVLEAIDIEERLSIVLELLAKERELSKLQKEINRQVEEKVSKQQREYLLREQLKSIKKELGMEKDDKDDLMFKYREAYQELEKRKLTKEEQTATNGPIKVIKEEMKKLETLEKNSAEFNVTRSYLDWLFAIPWGLYSKDVLNLQKAKVILDEDHYGLEEIKTRILEFIAVGKLKGSVSGKIICFIGPPGKFHFFYLTYMVVFWLLYFCLFVCSLPLLFLVYYLYLYRCW
jgi:Lon-like ATP-dependent protease